jgi:hypothetical protein
MLEEEMGLQTMSILDGVIEIFDRSLGCTAGQSPCFKSRTSYLRLDVSQLDGVEMVGSAFRQVCTNLSNRIEERHGSSQNWRWAKQLKITEGNPSREKQLEKAIACHTGDDWVNQVPTSSGVVGSGERHRNLDLVHRRAPGRFEFIELKVNSDNPLFAAIEIVCYGLVYLCSRRNAGLLGYPHHNDLLRATEVDLQVLAPATYYADAGPREQLRTLEDQLNYGLAAVTAREGMEADVLLGFRFEQFPAGCTWSSNEEVLNLIGRRQAVFSD